MITAIERRQRILEYLSDYRHATYNELANEFGVSKNTIVTDIVELSCSAPIFTTAGRYGGGIRVADKMAHERRADETGSPRHDTALIEHFPSILSGNRVPI